MSQSQEGTGGSSRRSGVVEFPSKPRVPLGQPSPAGGAPISFTDNGGPVIPHVRLILVFWGAWWNTTTSVPTVGQVTDAVVNILTGPYMTSLAQYRSIGSGYLQSSVVISEAIGSSPASPPSAFTNTEVETLLTDMLTAGLIPGPASDSNLLYLVMMPQGASQPGLLGEHTYFDYNGTNLHYGWVANSGSSLGAVTWVLSHELVESVTDPEGSAVTGTGCTGSGWCEIGDVCNGNTAVVNGVTVQRYWSQFDKQCVVPSDPVVKTDKDTKDHKDHKDFKDFKEHKTERKEIKDAKEKELPERPPPAVVDPAAASRIAQLYDALGRELAALSGQDAGPAVPDPASGQAFIQAADRPPVGEQALLEPYTPAPLY
jgi:hypothetical protein